MKQYFRIFREKGDEYDRYWASISTKQADGENYVSASISVRMSKDAEKVFKDNKEKTKTKGVDQCLMTSSDFWLKAVQPKDKEVKPFVVLFVNQASAAEQEDD